MTVKAAMHGITKVPSNLTIAEAATIMDNKIIGSVLVEEGNKVVGIMTERDILRKVVAVRKNPEITTVKDIMNSPLITVDSSTTLEQASDLMTKHKIRRLVVMENKNIVGIVTARDIAERIRYSIAQRIQNEAEYRRLSYGKGI